MFSTGNMVLDTKWSFASRERWAKLLGSACRIVTLHEAARQQEQVPLQKAA